MPGRTKEFYQMPHENTLDARRAALAVIDVQEAFWPHIPDFAELAARCALVAHAARLLGVPVVVTEQYPKGLGRTAAEIAAVLPEDFEPVEKTAFSSCGAQQFVARLEAARARLPGAPPRRLRLLAHRAEPPGRSRQDATLRRAPLLDRAGALRTHARRAPRAVQGDTETD